MSALLRSGCLLVVTNIVVLLACTQAGSNEANVSRIPATPASQPASQPGELLDVAAIVAAEDRDPEDLETDVRRKPAELLAFMRLAPGMKVADIGAGFGYTTELLALPWRSPERAEAGEFSDKFVLEFVKPGS